MGPLRKHFLVFWGVMWTVPHPPMSCITLMQKLFFFLYFDNSDILCVGTTESWIWYIFAVRRWRGIKIYIFRKWFEWESCRIIQMLIYDIRTSFFTDSGKGELVNSVFVSLTPIFVQLLKATRSFLKTEKWK